MQRVTFLNSRQLTLVGHLFPADSAAVVVMAHGFTSDKSSRGRFDHIARCLNEVGYSALAFDFSGCGESDNDSLTVAKQVDDLRAAIAYVKSRGFQRIALWGHSLGGRICLQAYTPEVVTMVLTGPGTGPMHYNWEEHFSPEQLGELAKRGRFIERLEEGPRRQLVIEAQMLKDFAEVDQEQLLTGVKCPALIIHGDDDEEERQLLALSRRGLRYLPQGSRLEVIHGAGHSFLGHLERVVELGRSWLIEHAPT